MLTQLSASSIVREFTGHNSPLISREEEMSAGEAHPGYLYNAFDTINLYLDGGMDPSKLVLGMPLYGRGFELVDPVSVGSVLDLKLGTIREG